MTSNDIHPCWWPHLLGTVRGGRNYSLSTVLPALLLTLCSPHSAIPLALPRWAEPTWASQPCATTRVHLCWTTPGTGQTGFWINKMKGEWQEVSKESIYSPRTPSVLPASATGRKKTVIKRFFHAMILAKIITRFVPVMRNITYVNRASDLCSMAQSRRFPFS